MPKHYIGNATTKAQISRAAAVQGVGAELKGLSLLIRHRPAVRLKPSPLATS